MNNTSRKTISIFGVTGSVGLSSVDVILQYPEKFIVDTIVAKSNIKKLAEVAKEIENNKGTIIPFLRFEFGANGTNHSLSEASFTATPSQIGIYNISDDATAHGRFGVGIEADFNNNWEIRATYDYY